MRNWAFQISQIIEKKWEWQPADQQNNNAQCLSGNKAKKQQLATSLRGTLSLTLINKQAKKSGYEMWMLPSGEPWQAWSTKPLLWWEALILTCTASEKCDILGITNHEGEKTDEKQHGFSILQVNLSYGLTPLTKHWWIIITFFFFN